jgi:MoxR-like ATPase
VILDELNLAEPQVLERLNPVLEREPSLVLTEGPGTRFGRRGDVPVHPRFRVFATMNPAEYQGRSLLSPAFRDRWVSSWQAQSPGELEYRQMLERVVFGRQPEVDVDGPWRGPAEASAPFVELAAVPGIGDLLGRIAALHAALVSLATPSEGKAAALGSGRRERYVFSRRGLLGLLDALSGLTLYDAVGQREQGIGSATELIVVDALERTYLDKIRGDTDRGRVIQAMRSLGLHRSSWVMRSEEGS